MRMISMMISWALALGGGTALAQGVQNRDLFLMAGPVGGTSQGIPGSPLEVSTGSGLAIQLGFGYQIFSSKAGILYLEPLPLVLEIPGESTAAGNRLSTRSITHFFTPGIRFKIPASDRLSFHGLVGGGFGSFRRFKLDPDDPDGMVISYKKGGVFDFGGGIDFRLSRGFSLRFEVRDFVGGADPGIGAGRHHVIPLAGLALHF